MFEIKTQANVEPETEVLFTIDDVEYRIPKEVGAEVALEAIERSRYEGEMATTAWCVEQVLGKAGWKALREVKGLDKNIVKGIMEICRERVMGGMEDEGKG